MPSHLRNSRDLSGEQRQRNVEAGLSNLAGQRTVQHAEGKPSISRPGADEGLRTKHRSDSNGSQLPSNFSSFKVGDVNTSSLAVALFDCAANRSVVDGESRSNYRPVDYPSVEPSSNH
ncbi:hypothetical protein KEM48_001441 [Puccinia striiformis f. sp. tritici PST-130]|uniref:Uncharacterized protein n=1 Tax=Puccinia striiformis f. sp. tritici PST-78 TaxID=1165861 RepID=A0A0L0VSF2_9BASI|nr:hypothetical protein KEM48_001441 [Puccinia striiformis f. sp. tritici PST-130]KNF02213.1 hypothetical protein PSTG_04712 [Puccinia striiformis f. sp. tritici PST-78]